MDEHISSETLTLTLSLTLSLGLSLFQAAALASCFMLLPLSGWSCPALLPAWVAPWACWLNLPLPPRELRHPLHSALLAEEESEYRLAE